MVSVIRIRLSYLLIVYGPKVASLGLYINSHIDPYIDVRTVSLVVFARMIMSVTDIAEVNWGR